jgi:drug/metabolite transporter (DMT)-like permease
MGPRTVTETIPVRPDRDLAALGAVSVTVVAWASAFVAIRWVGRTFEPGPLALGRLLLGAAALGALLGARRAWVRPTAREWVLLVVCGIAWFGVYNVALNAAEQRVDAGTTAMIVAVGPVLIAVFAGIVLGEGFPRWLVVGAAVAFGGAVLIGIATADTGHADVAGSALALLAAVVFAVAVLAQKPVLRRLPALQVTFLACSVGAIACLPFGWDLVRTLGGASAGADTALVYLGLVPTAIAFSTWAFALSRMDAGRLGVTTYLVPPITVALGWALLAEVPTALALAGGVVCLLGVALTRRR